MDIKKIEMIIETSKVCKNMKCCLECQYNKENCFHEISEFEFTEIIDFLYKKVNTKWE